MASFKRIVADFFLSGSTGLTVENRRRIILLNGILLLGFISFSAAGLSALASRRNMLLALVDGASMLIAVGLFVWLRLTHQVRVVGVVLTSLILVVFSFLMVTGGDGRTGPLWLYIFPLFSFFLVGGRSAISLNAALILMACVVLFVPGISQVYYDGAFKGRFLGSLVVLTGITYIFEYSRQDAQEKMFTAQKETDDIFHAIREGLFLLTQRDNAFFIGSKYSGVVQKMLVSDVLAGKEFIPLLKSHFPKINEDGLSQYLSLLYKDDLDEAMLADLNPLKITEGDRILSFTFYRVAGLKTGKIESVMCSIEDRTEEITLQRELAARGESDQKQTALLLQILHTNPKLLSDFLETASAYEKEINSMLSGASNVDAELLDTAFRKIHTIKGDARALGLDAVGEKAHLVEEKVAELKSRESVTGADLFPLVVELGALRQVFDNLHELTSLIRAHRGKETVVSETPIKDTLYNLVRQLKISTGKEVQLDTALFDEARLPMRMTRLAQEIFIQMIRNSFVHGIEEVTERLRTGKKAQGLISISLREKEGKLALRYTDDGAGLDAEKLKGKAVADGIASTDEIAGWEMAKIYSLIFRKGLSTAETASQDAGRGMGMDIIQENVRQLKGRIKLRTKSGKGVEFVFEFAAETHQDRT